MSCNSPLLCTGAHRGVGRRYASAAEAADEMHRLYMLRSAGGLQAIDYEAVAVSTLSSAGSADWAASTIDAFDELWELAEIFEGVLGRHSRHSVDTYKRHRLSPHVATTPRSPIIVVIDSEVETELSNRGKLRSENGPTVGLYPVRRSRAMT